MKGTNLSRRAKLPGLSKPRAPHQERPRGDLDAKARGPGDAV